MHWRSLLLRVRALLSPRRVERELDEELAFHIECETQKHLAAGLSPAEAHAKARARFGSQVLAAEGCRDARGIAWIETCARDVSYALRAFRRAPLVAVTIVATVALGLGLVATVFTIFNVGATTATVTHLVLSQSLHSVGIGLLVGCGLAASLAAVIMATPAAAAIGTRVVVFDLPAYAASLLCIAAACILAASIPALRAARIDPIAALRQE